MSEFFTFKDMIDSEQFVFERLMISIIIISIIGLGLVIFLNILYEMFFYKGENVNE